MTKIKMFIKKGMNRNKICGIFDTETCEFTKVIDYKGNQMFQHPKYRNQVAISKSIISEVGILGCRKIRIVIRNHEENDYIIVINFEDFWRKAKDIDFDDPQLMISQSEFVRIYQDQEVLEVKI